MEEPFLYGGIIMFKRILILIPALLLAGCQSGGTSADKLEETFSSTARIEEKGVTAVLERAEGSGWNITFSEPSTINGMQLAYLADGKCTLRFEGHAALYDRSQLPQGGVFDLVTAAADMCIEDKGVSTLNDGKETVRTGTVRGVGFTARSSGGKLTEIELNGGDKIIFS